MKSTFAKSEVNTDLLKEKRKTDRLEQEILPVLRRRTRWKQYKPLFSDSNPGGAMQIEAM